MKSKVIIMLFIFLFIGNNTEAQFLKKLKDKANKALGVESKEENKDANTNKAKDINTNLKKAFYTNDVVLKMYEGNQHNLSYYFDAEEIAMRAKIETDESKPMFYDSEGYQITYNINKESYEKTGLFKSPSMSMMISTQMVSAFKIPVAPFYEALEELGEKNIQVGTFNALAFAFIYKPEHFDKDPEYTKSTNGNTIKFSIDNAENAGSYVLFDASGRIREIYTVISNAETQGTSKLVYSYRPTSVKIPYAEEVKMPGQDLLNLGLGSDKNDIREDEPATEIKGTADLSLEKSIDNPLRVVGQPRVFTVELKNDGPEDATSIQVLDKLPDSYTLVNATATSGNYNAATGIWEIASLPKGKSTTLTFDVIIGPDVNSLPNISEINYMNLAEVIRSDQPDPDSTPSNGVDTDGDNFVVDDDGDEDDGDGQNLVGPSITSGTNDNLDSDIDPNEDLDSDLDPNESTNVIKHSDVIMVMQDKKAKQIYLFDFETLAMKIEYYHKKNNPMPVYFDNDGYVYSEGKNGAYMKIPFEGIKKMMTNLIPTFSMGSMPAPEFPDASNSTFYGMDVSPHKFPILEWAWVYKIENFEHPDFRKERIDCRGESGCTKFTVLNGRDKGAYIIFDAKRRLALIDDIKTGTAEYTYEPCTVTLPEAKEFKFPAGFLKN